MESSMMMRECTRKLALWHTKTFKPIMTHAELEPIMATLGFVALPLTPSSSSSSSSAAAAAAVVVWKEYAYGGGSWRSGVLTTETPPRPRLPYPRIDGLHIYTYQAFIDALTFYLHMTHISDLFHIRFDSSPSPTPIPFFPHINFPTIKKFEAFYAYLFQNKAWIKRVEFVFYNIQYSLLVIKN